MRAQHALFADGAKRRRCAKHSASASEAAVAASALLAQKSPRPAAPSPCIPLLAQICILLMFCAYKGAT